MSSQAPATGRPSGTDRLATACEGAISRLAAQEAAGIDPDTFAELGEALFWLIALADANGRSAPLLDGLRWARNRIAHGVVVVAPVEWHHGAEAGRLVPGKAVLGTTSGHEWAARSTVPPVPQQHQRPAQDAAYDNHVAGRRVVEVLQEGLALAR